MTFRLLVKNRFQQIDNRLWKKFSFSINSFCSTGLKVTGKPWGRSATKLKHAVSDPLHSHRSTTCKVQIVHSATRTLCVLWSMVYIYAHPVCCPLHPITKNCIKSYNKMRGLRASSVTSFSSSDRTGSLKTEPMEIIGAGLLDLSIRNSEVASHMGPSPGSNWTAIVWTHHEAKM